MIPVTDDHGESAGFVKHFGVGAGKVGKLPQGRILFENDLAIVVGVDLQGVAATYNIDTESLVPLVFNRLDYCG